MSDIIQGFKEKYYDIKEQVDKASKSIEVEMHIKLEQEHKLAIKSIEAQEQAELDDIKQEYEKRMKLLTSNRDKIDEYDKYVEAAQIQYNRKQNEIVSKYKNIYDSENQKFSKYKNEKNEELEESKRNICRKKFHELDKLRENEISSLMEELDTLSKEYTKEKEELEEKYKEKTKIAKEEFSSDGINKLECIYIPEEERKRIASYVLSGFLPTKLIDDKEILIGDEIGKRKVEDEKSNEESKTESDFRKINEEKYSEINEKIKQLKSLKFEDIEQEILNDEKTKEQIDEQDDFDSQER